MAGIFDNPSCYIYEITSWANPNCANNPESRVRVKVDNYWKHLCIMSHPHIEQIFFAKVYWHGSSAEFRFVGSPAAADANGYKLMESENEMKTLMAMIINYKYNIRKSVKVDSTMRGHIV